MNDLPRKKSPFNNCFVWGCLGSVLVLVAFGVFMWMVMGKAIREGAPEVYEDISRELTTMDISDAQREEADRHLVRLRDGFVEGDLGLMAATRLFETADRDGTFVHAALLSIRHRILAVEDWSDEEKTAAVTELRRVGRGISDGRIDPDETENIIESVLHDSGGDFDGIEELPLVMDSPTNDELLQSIAEARDLADQYGIEAEGDDVDLASLIKELVDSAFDD